MALYRPPFLCITPGIV